MTHDKIKERYLALDWSKTIAELSKETGIPQYNLYRAAHAYGVAWTKGKRGRRQGTIIGKLDNVPDSVFERRDSDIAKEYSVSRERVRQVRIARGLPKVSKKEGGAE